MTFILSSCQKHVSKQLFLKKINIPDISFKVKMIFLKVKNHLLKKQKQKQNPQNQTCYENSIENVWKCFHCCMTS